MWQGMYSAPRDGTIIEVKCSYGVAPWYALMRWNGEEWRDAQDPMKGVIGESTLEWRPTDQTPETYVDPTNGFQNDMKYWRIACGLPAAGLPAARPKSAIRWWQFWR